MKRQYRRGLSELLGALLALVIMAGITASIVIITDKLITSINNTGIGLIDRIQESTAKPLILPWTRNGTLYLKVGTPPGMTISSVILEFANGTYKIIDADQKLLESRGMPLINNYKCEPVRIGIYTTKGNVFYTEDYYNCGPTELPGSFKLSDGTIVVPEVYSSNYSLREVSIGQAIYLYGYSILNKTTCKLIMQAQALAGLFSWSLEGKPDELVEGQKEVIIETQDANITLRPYTYTNGVTCLIGVFLEAGSGGIIIGSGEIHSSITLLEVNRGDYANETIGYVGIIAHSENITANGQVSRQIDMSSRTVEGGGSIIIESLTGNTLTFLASSKSDVHKINYYVILNIEKAVILDGQDNNINLTLAKPLRYSLWTWNIESNTRGINRALEELYSITISKPSIELVLNINGSIYTRTPKHYYTELLHNTSSMGLRISKNLRQTLDSQINISLASIQQSTAQVKSVEYNITTSQRHTPLPPMPQVLEIHTANGDRIIVVTLPTPEPLALTGSNTLSAVQLILAGNNYTVKNNYTSLYIYELRLDNHTLEASGSIQTQVLRVSEQGAYLTLALNQQAGYKTPALLLIIAS